MIEPEALWKQALVVMTLSVGMAGRAAAVDLIGYVPSYRMNNSYINDVLPDQLAMLDEVRYFGITVDASAGLTTSGADLNNIQTIKSIIDSMPAATQPRLDITIGGAGQSGGFSTVAASASLRSQFAQNLDALLDQTGATAVDIDWEHPAVGAERDALYPAMLSRIKQEFGASRRITATVAPSVIVSNSIFSGPDAVDGVSLMTYDLGWWSNDPANPNTGQHSLHEYVEDAVQAWTDAPGSPNQRPWVFGTWGNNAPVDKLGVGLPFYGRGFDGSSPGVAVTYSELVANGTTSDGSAYQYFGSDVWIPGLDLVQQRVEFADAQGLRSIIIWELAQDLPAGNTNSMLRTAYLTKTDVTGDFNGDGVWDCSDIDALTAAIASMSADLTFDMDGDGDITLADITSVDVGWLAVGGANNPTATGGNPFLVGDATLDGTVDGLDFIEWNGNKFTNTSEWCGGDFNADGNVDGQDFIAWNSNKFTSSSGDVTTVPEPSACMFLWLLPGLAALRS